MLMVGSPAQIALAVVTSMVGCTGLACGVEGYLLRKTSWLQRILLMGGGIALMVPGWMSDLIGAAALAMPVLWQWASVRHDCISVGWEPELRVFPVSALRIFAIKQLDIIL
ncbi:hypothetical protein ACFLVX_02930 [Chloroflexota bacterium]